MATVTEKVKESLVGTEVEPQLSSQTRSYFNSHAVKDEQKDEYFMGEDQFVDAIAPQGEDYVRIRLFLLVVFWAASGEQSRAGAASSESKASIPTERPSRIRHMSEPSAPSALHPPIK